MRIGKGEGRQKSAKNPSLQPRMDLVCCIYNNLRNYSHKNMAWVSQIDRIRKHPKNLIVEINSNEPLEWLQKIFKRSESSSEISELRCYYKYYKNSPILTDLFYLEFMSKYWMKIKTIYYGKIKKSLKIQQHSKNTTFQKNILQQSSHQSGKIHDTFYVLPEVISQPSTPQSSNNNTLEKIVELLKRKTDSKKKNLKQIDKSYNFYKEKIDTHQSIKRQSKAQLKKQNSKSHSKNQLKINSSQLISHFSYQNNSYKIKNAHKSLSNETNISRQKIAKCTKLFNTHSSLNLPTTNEHELNYYRLQKSNTKNNQKEQKAKKNHKKVNSTQKSTQPNKKSKSSKKKIETKAQNVKSLIDKAKNKIQMEKNLMLKKYLQSRQSYTKSIDSTCGEQARHAKK